MKKNILLIIFLFAVFALTTMAQSVEDNVNSVRNIFTDIKTRSMEMERMKRESNKRPTNKDYVVQFPKIKEDFEQIQKINITKLQIGSEKTKINYKSVAKYAFEINKRAERLDNNLFPQKEAADKPRISENKDLKVLLNLLDTSITSFVHSPIFQNLDIVNLQESQKAQKDLAVIIETSLAIKEKAEQLKK